jgi:hypothetical protein
VDRGLLGDAFCDERAQASLSRGDDIGTRARDIEQLPGQIKFVYACHR